MQYDVSGDPTVANKGQTQYNCLKYLRWQKNTLQVLKRCKFKDTSINEKKKEKTYTKKT